MPKTNADNYASDNASNRTNIHDRSFDEERALYGLTHATLERVSFAGPADGESALKECRDLDVHNATFDLRYPVWHTDDITIVDSRFTSNCRAALWYASDVHIENSSLLGIKALRECDRVTIDDSEVVSQEFGWMSRNVTVRNSSLEGEYAFFHARDLRLRNVRFSGKYSFQYVENLVVEGGHFDTKDAFWHAHNVTVSDATLKGEYLGWYSDGLTLVRCRIEGTQPLVHCRNLTLVDCQMVDCDLAFEGSDVVATVCGHVDSIRDPRSGRIEVGSVGELVHDTLAGCGAQIVTNSGADKVDNLHDAVVVVVGNDNPSTGKYLGCCVAHGNGQPHGTKGVKVVRGVANSHDLLHRDAKVFAERSQALRLAHSKRRALERGLL